ncbi:hypothetical protein SELMODRAFT_424113 [Selaginella moellendorffii]|uniref:Auxin response factor domain-containing protein n=1 Tax=Selaginella moellendorffii TaxID=88036 RepID=D8SNV0_SELML|nr:hypothetical protein SELMODRAFT_424113 [Selaginella moellendorffii]
MNAEMEGGDKKAINQALWLECPGPLITLPAIGSQVVYFPQGHTEQVVASTQKEADFDIPISHLHADQENDEVFAQMTLQPFSQTADPFLLPDFGIQTKQTIVSFSRTLTSSGESSPRPLLILPRHLQLKSSLPETYTTSSGVSAISIEGRAGTTHAGNSTCKPAANESPSDSTLVGVLAAAAHAASTNSRFEVLLQRRTTLSLAEEEYSCSLAEEDLQMKEKKASLNMNFPGLGMPMQFNQSMPPLLQQQQQQAQQIIDLPPNVPEAASILSRPLRIRGESKQHAASKPPHRLGDRDVVMMFCVVIVFYASCQGRIM